MTQIIKSFEGVWGNFFKSSPSIPYITNSSKRVEVFADFFEGGFGGG